MRGNETEPWAWSKLIANTNFYLVFVLGAFGLFMFSLTFNSWIKMFEERNPDLASQKIKLSISQKNDEIIILKDKIAEFRKKIESLEKQNIVFKSSIDIAEREIEKLPFIKEAELEKLDSSLNAKNTSIERITDIYISHVESDNLPISIDSLKDRISVFLRGWSDYLHEEYAIQKAVDKSSLANDAANYWLNEKIKSKSVDLRLKLI